MYEYIQHEHIYYIPCLFKVSSHGPSWIPLSFRALCLNGHSHAILTVLWEATPDISSITSFSSKSLSFFPIPVQQKIQSHLHIAGIIKWFAKFFWIFQNRFPACPPASKNRTLMIYSVKIKAFWLGVETVLGGHFVHFMGGEEGKTEALSLKN